jgi:Phage integrase family
MLRSGELLPIRRDELNAGNGTVDIPARRVKRRRVINQPLSDLALEVITEAMGNYDFAFVGRFGEAPLARTAMGNALRGNKKTKGICELLGLAPFTPHDLRRSAATMCGELGLPESGISLCLDHQANKDENGKPLPAITRKVHNLATRNQVAKKRAVLDAWHGLRSSPAQRWGRRGAVIPPALTRPLAVHSRKGRQSASETDAYEAAVAILDGGDRLYGLSSRSRSGTMIQIKMGARQPPKECAQ